MKQKDLFKNGHAFLILPVILISIMVFIPMVLALITSFQSGPPVNMTFNGLGNYQRMLTDATFKKAFFNTFLYLLVQVPIMLFLALFICNLLNDKKLKHKGLFRTAIFLPCITSMVSYSLIMKSLFSQSGLVNNLLLGIGMIDTPIGWLTHPIWAKVLIILSITWRWTGYNMIFFLSGMQNIDSEIYEAASIDGASKCQQFIKCYCCLYCDIVDNPNESRRRESMKSMVEKETIAHPNVKKQALGLRSAIGSALKYTALSILSFISIFPFVWMILGMTNTPVDITSGKIKIGSNLIINFQNLFSNELNFTRSLWNSAMIALVTTVFALLISSMAGYGFEIYQSKRKDLIFNILLLSMMVPFAALMIPLYRMFSQLNGTILGINSFLVVILPSISTAFLIFFFRQNVKSFPKDLVEAARLDGLKELSIFFRVYMPTAKNTYAAAAIITFMSSWNNYLWPLVALQSPDKRTVPLVLSAMGASYTPDYGMIMAGLVIATLPTAIVFFVLQKQFVQGMIGSVK